MPYVAKADRVGLELSHHATTPGELNYLLSITVLDYLERQGLSYTSCNDIIGAFESAKREFQHRVVDPFEASKMRSNGDLEQYDHWRRVIG